MSLIAEEFVGRPRHPSTVVKRCEIRKNSDHDACPTRLTHRHNASADRSKKHPNAARLLLNFLRMDKGQCDFLNKPWPINPVSEAGRLECFYDHKALRTMPTHYNVMLDMPVQ